MQELIKELKQAKKSKISSWIDDVCMKIELTDNNIKYINQLKFKLIEKTSRKFK